VIRLTLIADATRPRARRVTGVTTGAFLVLYRSTREMTMTRRVCLLAAAIAVGGLVAANGFAVAPSDWHGS
jgi:hypothetical protein